MTILITGAAGFIGFHLANTLLERGEQVIGVDNLNDYYDPALKHARLKQLEPYAANKQWRFIQTDISNKAAFENALLPDGNAIHQIVNLAAQAGVRYSLENPYAYLDSNVTGQLNILEFCRHHTPNLEQLVYASSSSVYGGNQNIPFSIEDKVDSPVSLYAATKGAGELITHSYSHLYQIPSVGLRFFTVYGPWGRPDMAYFLFTKAITTNNPIRLFNHGDMKRDFTWIDDIIAGVIACIDRKPAYNLLKTNPNTPPHLRYNLGNNRCETLGHFVETLEKAIGKKALKKMEPMQAGDVYQTYANIDASIADLGYSPATTIEEGLPKFVEWYRTFYNT